MSPGISVSAYKKGPGRYKWLPPRHYHHLQLQQVACPYEISDFSEYVFKQRTP